MASDFHTHYRNSSIPALISTQEPAGLTFPTLECHPWYLPEKFITLPEYIYSALPQCVALGEIGLDKLHGPPLNVQLQYLEALLSVAADLNMPVIIHVVRAEEEFLALWKKYKLRGLIHGFCGGYKHLQMWLEKGFFVSLSPRMLNHPELSFMSEENGRIGFETDNFKLELPYVLKQFSEALNRIDLEQLSDERFQEFLSC